MIEAALEYARLGYPLLPLEARGKRPLARLVPHGLRQATTDPATIRRWFAAQPRANIGILPPAGVLVLDVDAPERWPELLAEYPPLEAAPRQHTPRGGAHVFVKLPPEAVGRVSATVQRIPGADVRGLGKAYLVAAPSSVNGKPYRWEVPLVEPYRLPLVPGELLARLLPPPPPPPAPARENGKAAPGRLEGLLRWACDVVAAAPVGTRHNALLDHARLVGGWLHHGLDEGRALEALTQAGLAAGLPQGEAYATARDGLRNGKAAPLPLPESDTPPAAYGRLRTDGAKEEERVTPLDGRTGGGEVQGLPRYKVEKGRILAARLEGRGEGQTVSYWPLCNFACVIRREVSRTDGQQTELWFELEGYAGPRPLPPARVRASEFAAMSWVVREWGAGAVVAPGQGAKDHLRAAIQYLSTPERATVYAHTGWARIGEGWGYLHAGGAIGASGVEVDLPPELAGFALPEPGRAEDALALLELAPPAVTWPLLLYALGAVLGHPMGSVYLTGPTGAGKTTLALLVQALWGHDRLGAPLNWEATANALEGVAFAAKDALVLVDDYAPTGHEGKQKELQAKAARLLRSQGNATGRPRMRADGTLHADRPPRGSLLVTGEDLPPGHSVRARCLVLELERGMLNLERVSALQREPKPLAAALAAWITWLAPRLEGARERLKGLQAELRPRYPAAHGRTTEALARLHAVWVLLREALEAEGVPLARLDGLEAGMAQALQRVGKAQGEHQRNADPAERFIPLLLGLLNAKRGHLLNPEAPKEEPPNPERWGWGWQQNLSGSLEAPEGRWVPQGPQLGWLDARTGDVLLNPEGGYAALNRLAAEQGEPLPSPRTLWKRLGERGIIRTQTSGGETRHTVVERIGGHLLRVVRILGPYISETGNTGNIGTETVQDDSNPVTGKSPVTGSFPVTNPAPQEPPRVLPVASGNKTETGNTRNAVQDAKALPVTDVTDFADMTPSGVAEEDGGYTLEL